MKIYIVFQCFNLLGNQIDKIFFTKQEAEKYINSFKMYQERKSRSIQEWKVENNS